MLPNLANFYECLNILSRMVDISKLCSQNGHTNARKTFFTDLMNSWVYILLCFKNILWNLYENTRIYMYEFKILNNWLTDHEYLQPLTDSIGGWPVNRLTESSPVMSLHYSEIDHIICQHKLRNFIISNFIHLSCTHNEQW